MTSTIKKCDLPLPQWAQEKHEEVKKKLALRPDNEKLAKIRKVTAFAFVVALHFLVLRTQLWMEHSIAEDRHDVAGLCACERACCSQSLSCSTSCATLTPDCVYNMLPLGVVWKGHKGATIAATRFRTIRSTCAGASTFYSELVNAYPDIEFKLTEIMYARPKQLLAVPQHLCVAFRIGMQGVVQEACVTGTQSDCALLLVSHRMC